MNELVFGHIEVSKSKFYENKKGIKLKEVEVDTIVISNKVKGNNETKILYWLYGSKSYRL